MKHLNEAPEPAADKKRYEEQEWEARKRLGEPPFDKAEGFETFDSFFAGLEPQDEQRAMSLYESYLGNFIHKAIAAAEERAHDDFRKILNSGKKMYEIGKAEGQRELVEKVIEAVRTAKIHGPTSFGDEVLYTIKSDVLEEAKTVIIAELNKLLSEDTDAGPGESNQ